MAGTMITQLGAIWREDLGGIGADGAGLDLSSGCCAPLTDLLKIYLLSGVGSGSV